MIQFLKHPRPKAPSPVDFEYSSSLSGFFPKTFLQQICDCEGCFRRYETERPVPPAGDFDAEWLIQGAAPGRQEVEENIPFNPKAPGGGLLVKYLEVLGIDRKDCYITNTCFCMGVNDRLPTNMESQICSGWKVEEYSRLEKLKYLVLLGNNAVRQTLGYDYPSVTRVNGEIKAVKERNRLYLILLVHHPGYLLRKDAQEFEKVMWALKNFKKLINRKENE